MSLKFSFLIIFFSILLPVNSVNADDLGKLFTSEQDRNKLDFIRNKPPEVEQTIEEIVIDIPIEEEIEKPTPELDFNLRLKGIVYRKDGNNTAWINDGNTYEGNLEAQFIQVPEENISDDSIQILMPDNETRVQLRVGDNYVPQSGSDDEDTGNID
ncbi:MAG: hypothetical protein AAF410_00400 [Pseudomonadota bacterium]